jgi:hypothetical protein
VDDKLRGTEVLRMDERIPLLVVVAVVPLEIVSARLAYSGRDVRLCHCCRAEQTITRPSHKSQLA